MDNVQKTLKRLIAHKTMNISQKIPMWIKKVADIAECALIDESQKHLYATHKWHQQNIIDFSGITSFKEVNVFIARKNSGMDKF